MQYICIRKCHHGKGEAVNGKGPPRRIYCPGDTESFNERDFVPRHFVPVQSDPPLSEILDEAPVKMAGLRAPVDREKLAKQKAGSKPGAKKET